MATTPEPPRRLKLLLDVHHSRLAAGRLRQEQHDVRAAVDAAHLAVMSDDDLLRVATAEQRAVVTENVKDFDRIARAWAAGGAHHAGLVFTSPRRFHRGSLAYPADLVAALRRLLSDPPIEATDWIRWLD